MRLRSLYLSSFKNLRSFKADFNSNALVTVILGWNGTGKSNLIEALVCIFRDLDLGQISDFDYSIEYECRGYLVNIKAKGNSKKDIDIKVDGNEIPYSKFVGEDGAIYRPGHIFSYYSGPSARLATHFSKHQNKFYRDLLEGHERPLRRLFFARPVHSQFVLLSFFCRRKQQHRKLLEDLLGIKAIESVLFVLREPGWYKGKPIAGGDERFWYARGVVRKFLDKLYGIALAPVRIEQRIEGDFQKNKKSEHVYLFLKDVESLQQLSDESTSTADFFKMLESTYISELLAEVRIRVHVKGVDGILTFRELSEGEQQLLTVLGLLEFTKEEESLFLLDEPDTHLNPQWSMNYVDFLNSVVNDHDKSQVLMATHDPVVISSLKKEQIVLLLRDGESMSIKAITPDLDPQGLGIAGILTSDMFGLGSTIDQPTLDKISRRILLHSRRDTLTQIEKGEYEALSRELSSLGFTHEFTDPYFQRFAAAMERRYKATVESITPENQKKIDGYADKLITEIFDDK